MQMNSSYVVYNQLWGKKKVWIQCHNKRENSTLYEHEHCSLSSLEYHLSSTKSQLPTSLQFYSKEFFMMKLLSPQADFHTCVLCQWKEEWCWCRIAQKGSKDQVENGSGFQYRACSTSPCVIPRPNTSKVHSTVNSSIICDTCSQFSLIAAISFSLVLTNTTSKIPIFSGCSTWNFSLFFPYIQTKFIKSQEWERLSVVLGLNNSSSHTISIL